MTFPDPNMQQFVSDPSRPLTDEERKEADRDAPVGERVYAPASERVPREPVPGHRDFIEHPDQATAERQAVATQTDAEPSFTRVPRPSPNPGDTATEWQNNKWMAGSSESSSRMLVPMGVAWLAVCGVGVWMWLRWQRERNKPINRLRRQARQRATQARQTAYDLRERMPEFPDQAARPAVGLGTAILSLAIVLWQHSQSRQSGKLGEPAAHAAADGDWQNRLMQLKERWTPGRLELEKVSISRH